MIDNKRDKRVIISVFCKEMIGISVPEQKSHINNFITALTGQTCNIEIRQNEQLDQCRGLSLFWIAAIKLHHAHLSFLGETVFFFSDFRDKNLLLNIFFTFFFSKRKMDIPTELKYIAPYIQRGQELSERDPIVSYYGIQIQVTTCFYCKKIIVYA